MRLCFFRLNSLTVRPYNIQNLISKSVLQLWSLSWRPFLCRSGRTSWMCGVCRAGAAPCGPWSSPGSHPPTCLWCALTLAPLSGLVWKLGDESWYMYGLLNQRFRTVGCCTWKRSMFDQKHSPYAITLLESALPKSSSHFNNYGCKLHLFNSFRSHFGYQAK